MEKPGGGQYGRKSYCIKVKENSFYALFFISVCMYVHLKNNLQLAQM